METGEVFHVQGNFDLAFNFFQNPWVQTVNDPYRLIIDVFLVINAEFDIELFSFGGIEIYLLPHKTVNFGVIDSDDKCVFGLGLVVDPNFL